MDCCLRNEFYVHYGLSWVLSIQYNLHYFHCSAQLINTEQERDKLSIEINRLSMQCQQLKSTQERLVAEHSKTLERVNELWKQKWPGAYDEVSIMHVLLAELWYELLLYILYLPCSYHGKRSTSHYHWYVNTNPHHLVDCYTYYDLSSSMSERLAYSIQGSDGLAGFSVVGGRDQPQLPNPGAFIVTTVTSGGPADGLIK